MNDFVSGLFALGMTKLGTIAASLTMATMAVLIDARKHTLFSALVAIVAGTVLGVIAATSITALMGWSESVGYGVSAVFAISGNNLIKWLLRVSNDPLTLWQRFRGGDDKK